MSFAPPPLPDKTLARVLRIAGLEGGSVLALGVLSLMVSAVSFSPVGLLVSALLAGCGAAELHGAKLLRAGNGRGLDWLVRAELALMATVMAYAGLRLATTTPASIHKEMAEMALLGDLGMDQRQLETTLLSTLRLTYAVVLLVTLLFQGGLALYYHRSRAAVAGALAQLPANNPRLTACPVCRQTVSRAAPMCPHCGHPLVPTDGV